MSETKAQGHFVLALFGLSATKTGTTGVILRCERIFLAIDRDPLSDVTALRNFNHNVPGVTTSERTIIIAD